MKRTVAVVTLSFALSLMAVAHGKEKHVMGTVTSVSDTSITVKTTDKKSVTVDVSDKTKFEKSGAAATLKDLKVGDKIAIHRPPRPNAGAVDARTRDRCHERRRSGVRRVDVTIMIPVSSAGIAEASVVAVPFGFIRPRQPRRKISSLILRTGS